MTKLFVFNESTQPSRRARSTLFGTVAGLALCGLSTPAFAQAAGEENDGEIMSYVHVGTGNYHSQTSNLYTDLGLLTCNQKIAGENQGWR